jgi:hypothetical protein
MVQAVLVVALNALALVFPPKLLLTHTHTHTRTSPVVSSVYRLSICAHSVSSVCSESYEKSGAEPLAAACEHTCVNENKLR